MRAFCSFMHSWGRWFNVEGGPPYRQKRYCTRCPASEQR